MYFFFKSASVQCVFPLNVWRDLVEGLTNETRCGYEGGSVWNDTLLAGLGLGWAPFRMQCT